MPTTIEEGVIKYHLEFSEAAPLTGDRLIALIAWRQQLFRAGMIGQDESRYGGVGFGNVSQRLPLSTLGGSSFIISGSQTAGLVRVGPTHFCCVHSFDINANRVVASGPIPPSSEAMTHGMLYRLDARIRFVFHVHSPELWQRSERLDALSTPANITYGTPAMAEAMTELAADLKERRTPLIIMRGHRDGVIAISNTAAEGGMALLSALHRQKN